MHIFPHKLMLMLSSKINLIAHILRIFFLEITIIKRYTNMDEFHKCNLKLLFSRENENLKTIKHTFVNTQSKFDL